MQILRVAGGEALQRSWHYTHFSNLLLPQEPNSLSSYRGQWWRAYPAYQRYDSMMQEIRQKSLVTQMDRLKNNFTLKFDDIIMCGKPEDKAITRKFRGMRANPNFAIGGWRHLEI